MREGETDMARHGENIRKRKDGRWEARVPIGKKDSGTMRYRYFYGKTYQEAREKRQRSVEIMPENRSRMITERITVSQLFEDWLFFIQPEVKESTYARYRFYVTKHILPELGTKRLDYLTSEELDRFARKKLQCGSLSGSYGLAPKTVNSILSVIRLALAFGTERSLPVPTGLQIRNVRQPSPHIQIFTSEEQKTLETVLLCHINPRRLGILLTLYTGLRIGEICGLQWGDIRLEEGILTVRRTVMRIQTNDPEAAAKTVLLVTRPKTDCSLRTIPLPGFMTELLKPYQKAPEVFLASGTVHAVEPRCLYTSYKRILTSVGLERYNYHALRHTFATRCIEQNFDPKSLSEILGHADVGITLRLYVHPSMELKRLQMERMANACFCGQNDGQKS